MNRVQGTRSSRQRLPGGSLGESEASESEILEGHCGTPHQDDLEASLGLVLLLEFNVRSEGKSTSPEDSVTLFCHGEKE